MVGETNLVRALGLPGAVMMGLGSIVGTGVFVSLGLAAGLSGVSMIFALFLAGCLAVCNGLSTAQLAANHPFSGGTYEYGNKYINPWFGYLAGWLFVCAKSASAATAAIGFGGYFVRVLNLESLASWHVGLLATFFVVVVAILGIRRSNLTNMVVVSVTLFSLAVYVLALAPEIERENFLPLFETHADRRSPFSAFFEATALMFVAYTGYGRVATLGEEVHDPVKNIPKAILATLGISFVIYISVAVVSVGTAGAQRFYTSTVSGGAPLEAIAIISGHPIVANILSVGALMAMLGVLLNLVLGVSRVIYAMGRKGDIPLFFSKIDTRQQVPLVGIVSSGVVIIALVLMQDIKITWSFSAFTVLVYYAITNVAALRLPKPKRLYPRFLAWTGLFGCLALGWWVEKTALILGITILLVGVIWRLAWTYYLKPLRSPCE